MGKVIAQVAVGAGKPVSLKSVPNDFITVDSLGLATVHYANGTKTETMDGFVFDVEWPYFALTPNKMTTDDGKPFQPYGKGMTAFFKQTERVGHYRLNEIKPHVDTSTMDAATYNKYVQDRAAARREQRGANVGRVNRPRAPGARLPM